MICEPNDDSEEAEPFAIPLANELIGVTQQADGVKVIHEVLEGSEE